MAVDGLLEAVEGEFEKRRQANVMAYELRKEEAFERCEGLEELVNERHSLILSGIGLFGKVVSKNLNAAEEIKRLNGAIKQKLCESGLPEDALKPVYTCAKCKDEGFVYEPQKKPCECYLAAMAEKMLGDSVNVNHTFANFDVSVYSDALIPEIGFSQRQCARLNRKWCEKFANDYPHQKPGNLLMTGHSGTGKTYLMDCMSHRIAERGKIVVYIPAYRLLGELKKSYFENNDDAQRYYGGVDLLMIDDLGSEPLMNNVTVEQLFGLVNDRNVHELATVVSTNLSANDLKARYTERVSSRLMDSSKWKRLNFYGEDVRK